MLLKNRLMMTALAAMALAGPAFAQENRATDAPGAPDGKFVITPNLPNETPDPARFQLTDQFVPISKDQADRMTMPVRIGTSGTYDFVIDTGSQRTIVAKEIAQRLALPVLSPVEIVSMAGRVTVDTVKLDGLTFGDHAVDNLDALSIAHNDLGGAGIIGLDSLKGKRLTMDFQRRKMDVGRSRRGSDRNDANTIVVEARSKFGQLILVDSKIDGRRVNVILDTGAELSVGNMALFNNLKLKKLVIPPQPTTLTSVTGITVPAQFTVVRRITIGAVTLDNVPMVFLDAAPFDELGLGDKPAMLLGMRMLRLFDQVAIDFGNRRVDFHMKDAAQAAGASRFASLDAGAATFR
ncbi:retroviral-like aspartic protease family protein [Sphingobium nicotianae]|uniref:Aspartyl protease family protein n=1 Tax=Sphingobium nicotianae TaxID=2782607 RepID=A0A9X1DAI7_9SPHN|nr:retroviral-like aspartic protease family protein [Sphingobium nicotianae]MBT2186381.1 aspartyl protease family protein [Sphingobium nicotianae]